MGLEVFFLMEQYYNEDFFKDYVNTPKKVALTTKVTFDIFMHALFIYLLIYFIRKR